MLERALDLLVDFIVDDVVDVFGSLPAPIANCFKVVGHGIQAVLTKTLGTWTARHFSQRTLEHTFTVQNLERHVSYYVK